ncbi:MAG: hypothetical protein QNJ67_03065 [Kiloniellales bacterium]|nr:hypothetical protein [Kiloniellales bacterium]
MDYQVFIHSNHKQMVGALVGQYAFKRNSRHADKFEVRIIDTKDYDFLRRHDGQPYLRDGGTRIWDYDDLQSFTPLRFLPPELMGYQGRAVITDPDVFAVGDIWDLLSRDMGGAAIMCRPRGVLGKSDSMATSVMLLDCAKLTHWRAEESFDKLFTRELDYADWIGLKNEPRESIALFENEWNDFDRLTKKTKLLHNTKRRTQPWKTGLRVDYTPPDKPAGSTLLGLLDKARRRLFGVYGLLGHYRAHPDTNQERFFFGLLRECLEKGVITEDMLRDEMARKHVRGDAFEVLERVPPLAA